MPVTATHVLRTECAAIIAALAQRLKRTWRAPMLLVALASTSACAETYEVSRVDNVVRAATIWKDRSEAGFSPHLCLEFSTAAHELLNRTANLKVPVTSSGQAIDLGYSSTASLAQIYTVSDIMQFGHATLYRLCEAAGNGVLSKQEYTKLVGETLKSVEHLLELQLTGTKIGVLQQIKNAQAEVTALDRQLEAIEKSPDSKALEDRELVEQQRKKAVDEYRRLVTTYEVTAIFPATDPLSDLRNAYKAEIDTLDASLKEKNRKKQQALSSPPVDDKLKEPEKKALLAQRQKELDDLSRSIGDDEARKTKLGQYVDNLDKMDAP